MPSASLLSGNMNNHVREAFQTNGLVRSHQQTQASSQTSLQKLPASSPQFLYGTSNPSNQQPPQHMQFPPPPPAATIMSAAHVTKNDSNLNLFNPLVVSQQQQSSMNLASQPSMITSHQNGMPGNNLSQPQILMSSIITNKGPQNPQQQLFLQAQQQQPSIISQQYQQMQHSTQQQIQHQHQQHQQQLQQQQQPPPPQPTPISPVVQTVGHQQVPITTIMIPAAAAAQLQSASQQIQQAVSQANSINQNSQNQILVFMIPYTIQQSPMPPTPDQPSLNSTLIRHHNSQSQTSTLIRQPNSVTHSRAVSSLSNSKQDVEKSFYVKANFSYTATRNKNELSFQKGDILHVVDTLQNNDYGIQFWLAFKVKTNGKDSEKGLIPNKNRAEEIALSQRGLDMNEHSNFIDGNSSGVISASVGRVNFLKRRAAQRSKSLCKDNWDNVVFDIGSFKLPTYERVVFKHPGFCRPVVIFGPLSDVAREKLLNDYPEKYSYPTGFSQSTDHPKVIRLKGVLDVIDQGKHALLDITPSAVEKLNYVNLAPIVIFMKTDSKSIIKEFRARAAKSLDPNARDEDTLRRDGKSSRKLLEQSLKLEKMWYHVFTATLDLSTMGSEMWYRKLRETIENQQSNNVWLSDKKSDKKSIGMNTNTNEMLFPIQSSQSIPCIDDANAMAERFSESLTVTSKSTVDLAPESNYGNRSQLRNAYAHSLAQKLARASSEPKLNGLIPDHDDDNEGEDDDDDDDDEIIKKPFPCEFENSSSVSSSNGATSFGQSSLSGSNLTYQQYPPPQAQKSNDHGPGSSRNCRMQPENIYPLVNNTYGNGNGGGGASSSNSNYHPLPPMTNGADNGYNNQSMNNINSNNVIDLSRNHETRGSAFHVYSDMNQNNYQYYNLNKI